MLPCAFVDCGKHRIFEIRCPNAPNESYAIKVKVRRASCIKRQSGIRVGEGEEEGRRVFVVDGMRKRGEESRLDQHSNQFNGGNK